MASPLGPLTRASGHLAPCRALVRCAVCHAACEACHAARQPLRFPPPPTIAAKYPAIAGTFAAMVSVPRGERGQIA